MIKKFNQLNEKMDKMIEYRIIKNLHNGFAIQLGVEDIDDFFDMIHFHKVEYNDGDREYINQKIERSDNNVIYIVLIGKKLYYTTKPDFWGQDLEVYIPSTSPDMIDSGYGMLNPYDTGA